MKEYPEEAISTGKPGRRPGAKNNVKIPIDWDRVKRMLMAQCRSEDIAEAFGVKRGTLEKRCKSDLKIDWVDFRRKYRTTGKVTAREKLYEMAFIDKVPTVATLWAKNHLDWMEKQSNMVSVDRTDFADLVEDSEQQQPE